MKLKEAIRTLEADGFTYVKKERCKWLNCVDYYFEKDGKTIFMDLPTLRRKARRTEEQMWLRNFRARLKFGIQQTMFSDWEYDLYYRIENPLEVA